jgi:kynurenine formamidase
MRVDGKWDMVQTNGYRVSVEIRQEGDNLKYIYATHSGGRYHSIYPTSGSVSGTHIEMTIHWNNGSVGKYTGDLTPNKFGLPGYYLVGKTHDQNNEWSKADWYSEGKDFSPV